MYSIGSIIRTAFMAICLIALQGCGNETAIDRKTMAKIMADVFLADQAVENNPSLNIQKDTMMVYPAIFEKHGVTHDEFEASVKYYLEDGEAYLQIIKEAKNILLDKENELSQLLKKNQDEVDSKVLESWWAVDSIKSYTPDKLLYDRYLRSMRWLVMNQERLQQWKFMDPAITDIPQNPQWWTNTLLPKSRTYREVFMEQIKKANEPIKKIENNEKAVSKLRSNFGSPKALNKARISDLRRR